MKITKQARRDAKQLFHTCKVERPAGREPRVRQAVGAVIAQKPRGYVAILSHFQRLVKLDLDRRAARVESAVPVSEALAAIGQGESGPALRPGSGCEFRGEPGVDRRVAGEGGQ